MFERYFRGDRQKPSYWVDGGRVVGVRVAPLSVRPFDCEVQTRKPGEMPPFGLLRVAQQYERELIGLGATPAGELARWRISGWRPTRLRNARVIAGRDLLHDRGVKITGAFGDRWRGVGQAGDAGPRLKLCPGVYRPESIAQIVGCDVTVVDLLCM